MIKRKIIFLGCTKFSDDILSFLIKEKHEVLAIFSIPETFQISYSEKEVKNSNFSDLSIIAKKNSIPFYIVDKSKKRTLEFYHTKIESLKPDVIIAGGWYYMISKQIRQIPKEGVWGLHASLLPNYAGGAPLVWALINGESQTGVTLFKMDAGIDDGDIISQGKIMISEDDNIKSLINKSKEVSKRLLSKALSQSKITYKRQDKSKIKIHPQRSPEDAEIDWSWNIKRIENFIKAQTKPYPGAWTIIGNYKITIWDAKIEKINS